MTTKVLSYFFALILFLFFVLYEKKKQVSQETGKMSSKDFLRLVIVSDTHRRDDVVIPDGDVLIHAGDSEWTASEMDKWASTHEHPHKIAVCGNMDYRLARTNGNLKHISYLQDSSMNISGVNFYGSPWTPRFTGVFQLMSKAEAGKVWSDIPTDVDVLITHGPPAKTLDVTSRGVAVGDEALSEVVTSIKPRVHCFGHIHESYGTTQTDDTLFCNAAVFNNHPPLVVDIPINKNRRATIVK